LAFEAEGHGDYSYDSGFKEASVILHRSKVDALVCGNDVMAIGARDAARRMLKLQVPRDPAIVGQDGIAMARWGCHDLTTVATDQVALVDAWTQSAFRSCLDIGPGAPRAWSGQGTSSMREKPRAKWFCLPWASRHRLTALIGF
jgi:hypothetical protein